MDAPKAFASLLDYILYLEHEYIRLRESHTHAYGSVTPAHLRHKFSDQGGFPEIDLALEMALYEGKFPFSYEPIDRHYLVKKYNQDLDEIIEKILDDAFPHRHDEVV